MATSKHVQYIEFELSWYEEKLKGIMDFVDANFPLTDIPDRTETEVNAKGVPIVKLVAKKEEMIKVVKDIMKDLPSMLSALRELRKEKEIQAAKIETRGGKKIPGIMNKYLEDKKEKENPE